MLLATRAMSMWDNSGGSVWQTSEGEADDRHTESASMHTSPSGRAKPDHSGSTARSAAIWQQWGSSSGENEDAKPTEPATTSPTSMRRADPDTTETPSPVRRNAAELQVQHSYVLPPGGVADAELPIDRTLSHATDKPLPFAIGQNKNGSRSLSSKVSPEPGSGDVGPVTQQGGSNNAELEVPDSQGGLAKRKIHGSKTLQRRDSLLQTNKTARALENGLVSGLVSGTNAAQRKTTSPSATSRHLTNSSKGNASGVANPEEEEEEEETQSDTSWGMLLLPALHVSWYLILFLISIQMMWTWMKLLQNSHRTRKRIEFLLADKVLPLVRDCEDFLMWV